MFSLNKNPPLTYSENPIQSTSGDLVFQKNKDSTRISILLKKNSGSMECWVNEKKKQEQNHKKKNCLNFKEKHELDFFYLFYNYIIQDYKPKVYSIIDLTCPTGHHSVGESKKEKPNRGSAQKKMKSIKKYTRLNQKNRISFYFLDFFSFFYNYLWLTKTCIQ